MGNEGRIKVQTEKLTPEEAEQRLEKTIMQSGGISFDMQAGDSQQHASVLLEVQQPLPMPGEQGKKSRGSGTPSEQSEFINVNEVAEVTASTGFDFSGERYAVDLHDAPIELQRAVDAAWDQLQKDLPAYGDDIPPELQARQKMLEPIIRARLVSVEPSKAAVKPEVAPEKTPEQKFIQKLQKALPGIDAATLNAAKADGGFVFRTEDGMIVGAKISPVVTGPGGHEKVIAWRVTLTAGSTEQDKLFALVQQLQPTDNGIEFRAKLGNMPDWMRRGLNNTANLKREVGMSDSLLFSAQALREQGKAFGRQMHERDKWTSDTPDSMTMDQGYIRWSKRPDGKWQVADTQGVRDVVKNAVYLADLSNAPQRVREAARQSNMFVMQGDVFSDLYALIPDSDTSQNKGNKANAA